MSLSVNSVLVDFPPTSGVRYLPSWYTFMMPLNIMSPNLGRPIVFSMLTEASKTDVGFAMPSPAIPEPDFLVLMIYQSLPWFKEHIVFAKSGSCGNTSSSDKTSAGRGDDTSVKIWSEHDVKLFRTFN